MKKEKFDINELYKKKILKDNCFICKNLIPREEIIYEDDNSIIFLDKNPPTLGYVLIALKNHYEDITEVPSSEFLEMQKILHKISLAIKKAFNPKRICVLNSGDTLKHFHYHIIPMYRDLHNNLIDVILKKSVISMSEPEKKEIINKIKENLR
jgi:diadenosine tetraphosphate (Ap4A) HIT family hydrolase